MNDNIVIKGAKENNLKNIDLTLPRNKLIVFTGVSGSGKSTLAFDTIFAEGQRKFMESLSSYARQFLGQAQKPNVESITGLSPSIAIDQKTTSQNPRSTVGTVTEIYDYLRLLYANIGIPYCPNCNKPISSQTIDQITDKVLSYGNDKKIQILAPMVREKKGTYQKEFESYQKSGYARVKVDGNYYTLDEEIVLDKNKKHTISVVVDRLILKDEIVSRLTESIESAIKLSGGNVIVDVEGEEYIFSNNYACPICGYSLPEITPRIFSFNSPFGACPECSGLGVKKEIDEKLILGDTSKSINEGALLVSGWNLDFGQMTKECFKALSKTYNFSLDTPIKDLPKDILNLLLYGNGKGGIEVKITYSSQNWSGNYNHTFNGVINDLKKRYIATQSDYIKSEIEKYMVESDCECCHGKRLKPEVLAIKIDGKNISELTDLSVDELLVFLDNLKLSKVEQKIAENIIKEIKNRLNFLKNVGLNYLTLSRMAGTLSGGESQRIRLATQIGSGLVGVLYILDEPSIGLHQRDNERLLNALKNLRDLGNTVIVVEHDEETILNADYLVDIGPYAGVHGGEVVACGTVDEVKKCKNSITAKYLTGECKIEVLKNRRKSNKFIELKNCTSHNLKGINVKIPLGVFTCITGVSGSGKSSLINTTLVPALSNKLNDAKQVEGKYDEILGYENVDKIISIDQSPIGRTPRSNPATYTGVFTQIRELFSKTNDAKEKGYTSGRFSFNIKGGRCEACQGDGIKKIEMYFLPDVYVPCEVCKGKRYNRETLEVKYKGKNIYDVLEMTIEEALKFFENIPAIKNKIQTLYDVGLGYIKLGQPATELSGGEAQRVKLATELSKRSTGKTVYVLDEPTTGLSSYDVDKLIQILERLTNECNTVVVIEHNLDVIKTADYIIDLGPEGGNLGGEIIAKGTPEEVSKIQKSYTGKFLKQLL
ncbi:MAG: excinuclease ABC subunit UvrA [Clostridiales bacterium]|nr:excinuclease ABC subunit UvrA [Candidatus Apopatousia equi]